MVMCRLQGQMSFAQIPSRGIAKGDYHRIRFGSGPLPEDSAADAHMCGAKRDCGRKVCAHAHRQELQPIATRDFGREREMRSRCLVKRRNAHEAGDGQPIFIPTRRKERIGILRQHAGLLRFCAGIDFDEQQQADGPVYRFLLPEPRTGWRDRPNGWRRTAPQPPWPCWTGGGRSDATRCRRACDSSGGHLAFASCTRFSPNTRWPAAITGSIASAPKVFDTATNVTSAGLRLASRHARAISARTCSRPNTCWTAVIVVIAGPVPAIPMRRAQCLPKRDGRHKAGHDKIKIK